LVVAAAAIPEALIMDQAFYPSTRQDVSDDENRIQRAIDFLNQEAKDAECPLCQANGRALLNEASIVDEYVSPHGDSNVRSKRRPHYGVYTVYCENFGFVAHHMESVVDRGIAAAPPRDI
jgi:hypothetical protein